MKGGVRAMDVEFIELRVRFHGLRDELCEALGFLSFAGAKERIPVGDRILRGDEGIPQGVGKGNQLEGNGKRLAEWRIREGVNFQWLNSQ